MLAVLNILLGTPLVALVTSLLTACATLLTAVTAPLVALLVVRTTNLKTDAREERKRQLEFVETQLRELYGPLRAKLREFDVQTKFGSEHAEAFKAKFTELRRLDQSMPVEALNRQATERAE